MARTIPLAESSPAAGPAPFERIAIVGFGLIGGSLALAIRQRWRGGLIIAIDRKDVVEAAMRVHAADVGGDDLVLAADADLIVLAAPVRQNLTILEQLASCVPGVALVTDVGSTKRATMDAARRLPERLQFVGGHPLAGAAAGGFAAARPDLFAGRPWILTPAADTPAEPLGRLDSLVAGLGAEVIHMTPEAHDRLTAYLSHLPQLAASALMHTVGEHVGAEGLALAGRGLQDTTRLASSPPGIWADVVATNAEDVRAAIDDLIDVLHALRQVPADSDALVRIFESAAHWKGVLEEARRERR